MKSTQYPKSKIQAVGESSHDDGQQSPACGAATGLRVASVLRLHRLVTLTAGLLLWQLGELSPLWQQEVGKKLALLSRLQER